MDVLRSFVVAIFDITRGPRTDAPDAAHGIPEIWTG